MYKILLLKCVRHSSGLSYGFLEQCQSHGNLEMDSSPVTQTPPSDTEN